MKNVPQSIFCHLGYHSALQVTIFVGGNALKIREGKDVFDTNHLYKRMFGADDDV